MTIFRKVNFRHHAILYISPTDRHKLQTDTLSGMVDIYDSNLYLLAKSENVSYSVDPTAELRYMQKSVLFYSEIHKRSECRYIVHHPGQYRACYKL